LLNEGVHLLPSIRNFYELADGKTKQRIVGSILDGKIEIENKEVRTTPWKQVILHLINLDKDFETNRKEKAGKITGSFTLAPLTDERCNYNSMIEYVTIRKLKG
jgi:hypothetical protein